MKGGGGGRERERETRGASVDVHSCQIMKKMVNMEQEKGKCSHLQDPPTEPIHTAILS